VENQGLLRRGGEGKVILKPTAGKGGGKEKEGYWWLRRQRHSMYSFLCPRLGSLLLQNAYCLMPMLSVNTNTNMDLQQQRSVNEQSS